MDGTASDAYGSLNSVSPSPEPALFVAVRLVAPSGQATSPAVVGYQVRAVPAPKRSRLIQATIMLFDFETDRKGLRHGQVGGAFLRLKALEDLESSAGVVLWRDFTTGEVAEAYIERVSLQRTTPPTRANGNAGGVGQVVLRLI